MSEKHTAELVVHKTWSGDASELQARADCKKCADEVEDDFVTGRDGSPGTVRLIGGDLEAFKLVLEAAVCEPASPFSKSKMTMLISHSGMGQKAKSSDPQPIGHRL
jgi:hypothetical protein